MGTLNAVSQNYKEMLLKYLIRAPCLSFKRQTSWRAGNLLGCSIARMLILDTEPLLGNRTMAAACWLHHGRMQGIFKFLESTLTTRKLERWP